MWFTNFSTRKHTRRYPRLSSRRLRTTVHNIKPSHTGARSREAGLFRIKRETVTGLIAITTVSLHYFFASPALPPVNHTSLQSPPPPTRTTPDPGPPSSTLPIDAGNGSALPLYIGLACAVAGILVGAGSAYISGKRGSTFTPRTPPRKPPCDPPKPPPPSRIPEDDKSADKEDNDNDDDPPDDDPNPDPDPDPPSTGSDVDDPSLPPAPFDLPDEYLLLLVIVSWTLLLGKLFSIHVAPSLRVHPRMLALQRLLVQPFGMFTRGQLTGTTHSVRSGETSGAVHAMQDLPELTYLPEMAAAADPISSTTTTPVSTARLTRTGAPLRWGTILRAAVGLVAIGVLMMPVLDAPAASRAEAAEAAPHPAEEEITTLEASNSEDAVGDDDGPSGSAPTTAEEDDEEADPPLPSFGSPDASTPTASFTTAPSLSLSSATNTPVPVLDEEPALFAAMDEYLPPLHIDEEDADVEDCNLFWDSQELQDGDLVEAGLETFLLGLEHELEHELEWDPRDIQDGDLIEAGLKTFLVGMEDELEHELEWDPWDIQDGDTVEAGLEPHISLIDRPAVVQPEHDEDMDVLSMEAGLRELASVLEEELRLNAKVEKREVKSARRKQKPRTKKKPREVYVGPLSRLKREEDAQRGGSEIDDRARGVVPEGVGGEGKGKGKEIVVEMAECVEPEVYPVREVLPKPPVSDTFKSEPRASSSTLPPTSPPHLTTTTVPPSPPPMGGEGKGKGKEKVVEMTECVEPEVYPVREVLPKVRISFPNVI
ncbi:hypothetical protein FPV67DRAFT_646918 [Lyophyllum atratum]|nr:hypothetical protein FPV67DRAFT_646918 [Lyophyllum atratum]